MQKKKQVNSRRSHILFLSHCIHIGKHIHTHTMLTEKFKYSLVLQRDYFIRQLLTTIIATINNSTAFITTTAAAAGCYY